MTPNEPPAPHEPKQPVNPPVDWSDELSQELKEILQGERDRVKRHNKLMKELDEIQGRL